MNLAAASAFPAAQTIIFGSSLWWFSAIDIVRAINDEDDYVKAGSEHRT